MIPQADMTIGSPRLALSLTRRILRAVDEEQVLRGLKGFAGLIDAKESGGGLLATPNDRHAAEAIMRRAALVAVGNWIQDKCQTTLDDLQDDFGTIIRNQWADDDDDQLFKTAHDLITTAFGQVLSTVERNAAAVADAVARHEADAYSRHHGVKAPGYKLPNARQVAVLGLTIAETLSKAADDLLLRFKQAVRVARAAGDTAGQAVKRIEGDEAVNASHAVQAAVGTRFQIAVDLMDKTGKTVSGVIQAALTAFANEAASAVAEVAGDPEDDDGEGKDIILRWVAVLDERTCEQCEFYDGKAWDRDGEPVGEDDTEDPGDPPLHPNCRCAKIPEADGEEGGSSSFKNFESYLSQFTRSEQEQVFGKAAVAAYRKGDLSAGELVGQTEHKMSLEDFRQLRLMGGGGE